MDGLKILMGADGKPRSKFWYTRFTRCGEKVDVSLAVPIRGKPPKGADGRIDLSGTGDAAFEKSRAAALAALEGMRKAARTTGKTKAVKDAETADLVNRFHRARTGKAIESTRLDALAALWRGMERNYTPTMERTVAAERTFKRFAAFAAAYCREHGGKCETLDEITPEIAAAWFKEISSQFAWGTVRPWWNLMSTSWRRWHIYTTTNPFDNIVIRNREASAQKVERRPLTEAELTRLFQVTVDNPVLHGLVVTAACTGMRIGDCCRLKWSDIDFRRGLIDVVTAKAGVRVTVPLFAPLRKILSPLKDKVAVGDSPFVWPQMAKQYDTVNAAGLKGNSSLYRSIKPYFARAIFPEEESTTTTPIDKKPKSKEEVLAAIDGAGWSPQKTARARQAYLAHTEAKNNTTIAAEMGLARGQVSDYLRAVEEITGERLRPMAAKIASRKTDRDWLQKTRGERKHGKCAASIFGWHNLRHTFVVLALQAGVPVNDVSRIVGHGDVSTTMTSYGNSSREVVAERMRNRMTGSAIAKGDIVPLPSSAPVPTPSPSVDELIAVMTEEQRKALARKLLGL